jgi:hypothetical protein
MLLTQWVQEVRVVVHHPVRVELVKLPNMAVAVAVVIV